MSNNLNSAIDYNSSNKRIAINTILLYFRMLLMMGIGLYTSRVILNALGVSDLGLMNVTASVVTMFSFLKGTITGSTQRFLSFALGEKDISKVKSVFSCALTLHLGLALLIFILGETIGLWYIFNKLNVEPGRFNAALWCYQFSIIGTMVRLLQVPFNASLLAHEKMNVYAYMSIYDASVHLIAAYLIQITPFDRLIFYSFLSFLSSIIAIFIYNTYCRIHFEECSFRFGYKKGLFKEMLSYSGWDTIGNLASMGQGSGVNILVNYFCGTVVNGARGIAFQANSWATRFVNSFIQALSPQIIKSYAAGNIDRMSQLIVNGSRYGAYLLLFLGIPLFVNIEWVLHIWLGQCPSHTVVFMRIFIVEAFFRTIGRPTIIGMHAIGKMKVLNLSVGSILLLILPISYLLFSIGCSPEIVFSVNVIPWIIVPLVRIYLINKYTFGSFSISYFIIEAMVKPCLLTVVMFVLPYFVREAISGVDNFLKFIVISIVSFVWSSFIIYFWGLDRHQRKKLRKKLGSFFKRL